MLLILLRFLPLLGGLHGCETPCLCDMDKLSILGSIVISMEWDILYVSVPVPYVLSYNFKDKLERVHYRKEYNDGFGNQIGTYILTLPNGNQTVYMYTSKDGNFKYNTKSLHHKPSSNRHSPATVREMAFTIFLPTYKTDLSNDTLYLPHTSLKDVSPSRKMFVKMDIPCSCDKEDITGLRTYDVIEAHTPVMGMFYINETDEESKMCFQKVVNLVEIQSSATLETEEFHLSDFFSILPLPDEKGFSEELKMNYLNVVADDNITMIWSSTDELVTRNRTTSQSRVKDKSINNDKTNNVERDEGVREFPKAVRVVGDFFEGKLYDRRESRTYVPLPSQVYDDTPLPTSTVAEEAFNKFNRSIANEYLRKLFLFVKGGIYANDDTSTVSEVDEDEILKESDEPSKQTEAEEGEATKHVGGGNSSRIQLENEADNSTRIQSADEVNINHEGGNNTRPQLKNEANTKHEEGNNTMIQSDEVSINHEAVNSTRNQSLYLQAPEESKSNPVFLNPKVKDLNYAQRYIPDRFKGYYGQEVLNELETAVKLPQQVETLYQAVGTICRNLRKTHTDESFWFFTKAEIIIFILIMMVIMTMTVLRSSSRHRLVFN